MEQFQLGGTYVSCKTRTSTTWCIRYSTSLASNDAMVSEMFGMFSDSATSWSPYTMHPRVEHGNTYANGLCLVETGQLRRGDTNFRLAHFAQSVV